MAETITAVVDLIKPEVGGSFTTWGNRLNEDMDKLDSWLDAEHKLLSTSIQNGGNLTGTFTDYDASGNAITPPRNLSDESFRTMQNLLFYADTLNDDPMNDIPANRPGALVTQKWVRMLVDLFVPIGSIMMWSGATFASIPAGWCPCNGVRPAGSEVTPPNLMGRFVLGAYPDGDAAHAGMQPGQSYGAAGVFGHTHTITIGNTSLNYTQLPAHVHDSTAPGSDIFICRMTSGGSYAIAGGGNADGWGQGAVGDAALINNRTTPYLQGLPHNHTGTSTNDNAAPPYWAVIYIMKYKNLADAT